MAGTENEKKGGPLDIVLNTVKGWPMWLKVAVGVAVVALIVAGAAFNKHNAQFAMTPLYTKEISASDIEEIKLQLTKLGYKEGVEFTIVKGEKTSSLSAQQTLAGKMRSQLADLGLPRDVRTTSVSAGGGGLTDTEDQRKLKNLHALEGDMESSIIMMEGINNAKVKIVPQKEAVFEEDKAPAKATVMVATRDGYSVSKSQIKGIVSLVAGSVEGLTSENVKVVDTRGFTLSDLVANEQNDEFGAPSTGAQQERQKDFEQTLSRSAQGLLDKTVGEGNAYVEVRATLNFDQKQQDMTIFGSPTGGSNTVSSSNSNESNSDGYVTIGGRKVGVNQTVGYKTVGDQVVNNGSTGVHVVSEQIDSETYANDKKNGDSGVTPSSDKKGASDYNHTVTQKNYELDKRETRVIVAPGGVERLSVALMLNNVPEDRVESIKEAVAAAVGIDGSRGDQISVTNFPFQRSEYDDMRSQMLNAPAPVTKNNNAVSMPAIDKKVLIGAGASAIILMMVILALFLAKQKKSTKEKMSLHLTVGPNSSVNPISDLLSDKSGRTVAPSGDGASYERLTAMAKEQPNKVAELLKTSWMADK